MMQANPLVVNGAPFEVETQTTAAGATTEAMAGVTGTPSRQPLPRRGVLRRLTVQVTANTLNNTCVFTVLIGGVASLLTLTVGAGATGQFTADVLVPVVAGALVSLNEVAGAGAGNITASATFDYQPNA